MNDIIPKLQDMRYLKWTKTRKSSGTAGSFLKSFDDTGRRKKYYKLSDYDPLKGIVGHECINEIIVQRLLRLLKIEHLEYTLIHAKINIDGREIETWLCESEDFKRQNESKLAFEDYYLLEKEENESPMELCLRKGWEKVIHEMFLVDYLVLNRDRHGANMEVLRDRKNKTDRLAPLFDHGLSLICSCHTIEELECFDVMEDKKVQSFVGTSSSLENLNTIPEEFFRSIPGLTESGLSSLFEGLNDTIHEDYIVKMREMIRGRWDSLGRI